MQAMVVTSSRRFSLFVWLTLAVVGWTGLLLLAREMLIAAPPRAGFDLQLLLEAGRRVTNGLSPYDPALLGGSHVEAESLFYSYPPPVAQAMTLVAWLPSTVVLGLWAVGAMAGLAAIAMALGQQTAEGKGRSTPAIDFVLPVLGVAPFVFPFAASLLFGNLDAWFPLAYGLILLAVLDGERNPRRRSWVLAGAVIGVISVAKLHPASLGLWFVVRGWHQLRHGQRGLPPAWLAVTAAILVVVAIIAVSLGVAGIGPWADYLKVVQTASAADLVDQRNLGPAAQLAMLVGGDDSLARLLQIPAVLLAAAVTSWAAMARRDPLESLAWAATASLVTLPVTWFHYPVALIPFAVVAWVRARGTAADAATGRLIGVAVLTSVVAILLPVTLWFAVAAVLGAVRRSARVV